MALPSSSRYLSGEEHGIIGRRPNKMLLRRTKLPRPVMHKHPKTAEGGTSIQILGRIMAKKKGSHRQLPS